MQQPRAIPLAVILVLASAVPAAGQAPSPAPAPAASAAPPSEPADPAAPLRTAARQLADGIGQQAKDIASLHAERSALATEYYSGIARIDQKLAAGSPADDPELVRGASAARAKLDALEDNTARLQQLSQHLTDNAASALYLLQQVRTAEAMAGTPRSEEDALEAVEARVTAAQVGVDQRLRDVLVEIGRENRSISVERRNLAVLEREVASGAIQTSRELASDAPGPPPAEPVAPPAGRIALPALAPRLEPAREAAAHHAIERPAKARTAARRRPAPPREKPIAAARRGQPRAGTETAAQRRPKAPSRHPATAEAAAPPRRIPAAAPASAAPKQIAQAKPSRAPAAPARPAPAAVAKPAPRPAAAPEAASRRAPPQEAAAGPAHAPEPVPPPAKLVGGEDFLDQPPPSPAPRPAPKPVVAAARRPAARPRAKPEELAAVAPPAARPMVRPRPESQVAVAPPRAHHALAEAPAPAPLRPPPRAVDRVPPPAAAAVPESRPLLVIVNEPDEHLLYAAVAAVIERSPNASFTIRATTPGRTSAARWALQASDVQRRADQVVRSLAAFGLPRTRISETQSTDESLSEPEVEVFVHQPPAEP